MERLIDQRLGKYLVREEVGHGTMGTVYRGYDAALQRHVAIKVLDFHRSREPEFVERFLREARTAARLRHPGIVTVHDVGQEGSRYYFVMEFLEGPSLREYMRQRSPLPSAEALALLRQLAAALDYAHGQGVVHRDVKPANVMIVSGGRAVLTDFSIVKAASDTQLTGTGVALGTPAYMAPEQASEGQVTAATDLYALAVIAYEMLGGHPPFQAESTLALLYRIVHEPPVALSQYRPDLPLTVSGVLTQALAKNPRQRYPSGGAFVAALGQALGGQAATPLFEPATVAVSALGGRRQKGRKGSFWGRWPFWAWALLGGLVILLAGFPLIMLLESSARSRPSSVAPTAVPPTSRIPLAIPTGTPSPRPTSTKIPPTTRRPTVIATPTPGLEITKDVANVRTGPGLMYEQVGALYRGNRVRVIAWATALNNERWLLVEMPSGVWGWIHASGIQENSAVSALRPAATVPPTPTPSLTPTPASQTVTVWANRPWQDTRIWVNAGETVEIQATGRWSHTSSVDRNCPSPYYANGCGYNHAELLMPSVSTGFLLGQVGGETVAIGTGRSWQPRTSGNLLFCMNEDPDYYGDNYGSLTVTILIRR